MNDKSSDRAQECVDAHRRETAISEPRGLLLGAACGQVRLFGRPWFHRLYHLP